MEPTPFDLNAAVRRWQDELARSPTFRGENLDELGAHQRDSVAEIEEPRLTTEEAFLIAVKRIGRGACLATEFGKVNGTGVLFDRILCKLIGIQAWIYFRNCWARRPAA